MPARITEKPTTQMIRSDQIKRTPAEIVIINRIGFCYKMQRIKIRLKNRKNNEIERQA